MLGTTLPVRMPRPVFQSATPTKPASATLKGPDQVTPWSGDRRTAIVASQLRPPSMERLTSIARFGASSSKAYPIWYAVPFGEIPTHGSLARWNVPPLHRVNFAKLVVQVWPPSKVAAVTSPLAPPFDQRSCCQIPIRCLGLPGSTAANG